MSFDPSGFPSSSNAPGNPTETSTSGAGNTDSFTSATDSSSSEAVSSTTPTAETPSSTTSSQSSESPSSSSTTPFSSDSTSSASETASSATSTSTSDSSTSITSASSASESLGTTITSIPTLSTFVTVTASGLSSQVSPTTLSRPSLTSSATAAPSSSSSHSSAAVIGGAIGGILGAVLLGSLAFTLLRRYKGKRDDDASMISFDPVWVPDGGSTHGGSSRGRDMEPVSMYSTNDQGPSYQYAGSHPYANSNGNTWGSQAQYHPDQSTDDFYHVEGYQEGSPQPIQYIPAGNPAEQDYGAGTTSAQTVRRRTGSLSATVQNYS